MTAPSTHPPPGTWTSRNLLTVLEVAEWTCVHPKTIYRWIKEGKLYAIQFGFRIFRLPENATGEFLQQVSYNKADRQNIDGLDQAISRYKGEFLEVFSMGDPAPFDGRVRQKAEYLHHRFLEALHLLAVVLELSREHDRAMSYARQGEAIISSI